MRSVAFQVKMQDVITQLLDDGSVTDVRKNYSGRGMYGKKCVGVVYENAFDFFADVINCLDEDITKYQQNLEELLRKTKTDGMGFDTILYWPEWEWDDALDPIVDEEEEECEEE